MTTRRAATSSWRALLLAGVLTFLVGLVVGGWIWPGERQPVSRSIAPVVAADVVRHRSATIPVRLEIPAIALSTSLVPVGLMSDRTVEVPKDPSVAGWFRRGPVPGRSGSAVILGHIDSGEGPAVFARLQELRAGDLVTVQRANGSTVRFVVRRSVLYANADFPAQRVYAAQGTRRLNLVTCGGRYDAARGGYQSNLVVYTAIDQA